MHLHVVLLMAKHWHELHLTPMRCLADPHVQSLVQCPFGAWSKVHERKAWTPPPLPTQPPHDRAPSSSPSLANGGEELDSKPWRLQGNTLHGPHGSLGCNCNPLYT